MTSSENPYPRLRSQAFSVTRDDIQIPAPPDAAMPWGIVMESGLPTGTMTLVAFADGTASIYFSTGAVVIGGGQHESIRKAARSWISTATGVGSEMKKTSDFPAPTVGQSVFYLRTDDGVLAASAKDEEMMSGRHPLSELFRAAHELVTQYRLISTSRGR